ncbi:hypothetical protein [Halorussus pelagicus]|nr:hypothetical protein [Halorussus pelagicus]
MFVGSRLVVLCFPFRVVGLVGLALVVGKGIVLLGLWTLQQ